MKYLLLLMILAVPALAQNPDVPNAALALDLEMGTNYDDEFQQERIKLAILMPISDRLTIRAGMTHNDFTLKQRQAEGLWKFESQSTTWEIGFRVYIGNRED